MMYINEKYTSACFYVIIDDKENFVFYEFDKGVRLYEEVNNISFSFGLRT